jgi:hypothetical protein
MPIVKSLKRDCVIVRLVVHGHQMAKSQQANKLRSRTQRQLMDSLFEVGWPRQAEREFDSKHRSTRVKWVSDLGALAFHQVLVNPKTPDFRFERRPWNPELGSRARRSGDAALALSQNSFDDLHFTI